jgi:acyl-CoA thioesterase FadM
MRIVQPHSDEYLVRGFDCGYGGPLRPFALFNFFQEAAGNQADTIGIGMDRMQAEGKTWMISRIDLRIEALPFAGEKVAVETWPAGRDRLFALRDFILRGPDGGVLARAVYAYLIVDMATRRPVRPERFFGEGEPIGEAPHPVEDLSFAVPHIGTGAAMPEGAAFALSASSRHIDNNGHVNNAHIANWLIDALPRDERGSGRIRGARIDFSGEILAGDLLEARWSRLPDTAGRPGIGALTELRRGEEVVARAELAWD